MEEQSKELQDYLVVIKKRKAGIMIIAVIILVISVIVAFSLPPKYKSSATILIEQQEIPQELVMSTVTSYASERIRVIQARVMSRSNLMDIVEKYDLYRDQRKHQTTEEIIARMQEDVGLEMISAQVVDPRTGKPASATIAFSLSYQSESSATAQKVANELTSLYLNENLKNRAQKAEETSLFFKQETERLGILISALEQKLAVFKQENADMLPELKQLNLQILQRKETEVRNIETRLNTLEEKRFYLNGQLAMINPGNPAIMSSETRLKLLESEYASARARYSGDHPDIKKMKREIDALKQEVGGSNSSEAVATQISSLRQELNRVREKYTAEHPDVVELEEKIASLNIELADMQNRAEDKYYQDQPDNPAYITLQAQLAGIDSEINSLLLKKEDLFKEIENLENTMLKAPQVEREYRALMRDYENAISDYRSTKTKQSRADVAKQLESEKKGERFTLIDPPALPEEPISPNRPAILFLGFVFSLGSGVGFAFVADAVSGAIRGARNIRISLGIAPLAVIPYQMNMAEIHKKKTIRKRTIIIGLLAILSGILLIHFLISPLDVMWFRIMRKLDILAA